MIIIGTVPENAGRLASLGGDEYHSSSNPSRSTSTTQDTKVVPRYDKCLGSGDENVEK